MVVLCELVLSVTHITCLVVWLAFCTEGIFAKMTCAKNHGGNLAVFAEKNQRIFTLFTFSFYFSFMNILWDNS